MTAKEKFLKEFVELCEKHKLAIVPTYCWKVSFHDPMTIIPFDDHTKEYIENATLKELDE
jgi:hypothetical protein